MNVAVRVPRTFVSNELDGLHYNSDMLSCRESPAAPSLVTCVNGRSSQQGAVRQDTYFPSVVSASAPVPLPCSVFQELAQSRLFRKPSAVFFAFCRGQACFFSPRALRSSKAAPTSTVFVSRALDPSWLPHARPPSPPLLLLLPPNAPCACTTNKL